MTILELTAVVLAHEAGEQKSLQLGLLFLIATPVARVVFSVFAFAIQRDSFYVVVTLVVLAVLAFSLTGAHW